MARVLVVEDEDIIRNNILRILRAEGFEAFGAPDGRGGLHLAMSLVPDVVICDINMPIMDGFALLDALRAEPATRAVPFIFLTAQDDRATFRRGMSMGADDFIPKPFMRDELLDAINSRIKRKEQSAGVTDLSHLHQHFSDLYAGKPASMPFELQAVTDARSGAVLAVELKNVLELAKKLSTAETSHLLQEFFMQSTEALLAQGAEHLTFSAAGMVATFAEQPNATAGSVVGSSRDALLSAARLIDVDGHLADWVNERFRLRGLDAPKVCVLVHAGAVAVPQLSLVGVAGKSDVLEAALDLQATTRNSPMRVKASDGVVARGGNGFDYGEPTSVTQPINGKTARLRELKAVTAWARREGMHTAKPGGIPQSLRACMDENIKMTTRAIQEVLTSFTPPVGSATEAALLGAPEFKGYRLLKKIGQGGMSRVFMAQRDSDSLLIALKVLDLQSANVSPNALANNQIDRFVQEYALVSRVNHPNVVRIFDQGFTDDHAYIAMEYFEGGDVKQRIKRLALLNTPERREQAITVVRQAASALVAVHAEGITHRDIKPENLMFRADGSLALADFGIAKHTQQATLTQHGYIVGTPLYLSPEQACGQPATAASDLYSLGVIFFELLSGVLPFSGDNVQSILAQHMIAPVPSLPPEFADLQPVVDWLLSKDAVSRCPRATALVERLTSA